MLRTARPLPGGQGPQLARSSPFARRYSWLPAAEAVWGISDPNETFRRALSCRPGGRVVNWVFAGIADSDGH
jgi:hypothetical protein